MFAAGQTSEEGNTGKDHSINPLKQGLSARLPVPSECSRGSGGSQALQGDGGR